MPLPTASPTLHQQDADAAPSGPALELRGIGKSFGGVRAVSGVDLIVRPGETLGLVGENGAGKSTLMKIISGVHPDGSFDGELYIDGARRSFRNVREAEAAGVVLVPQELHVAPNLSIAENMFMGNLPGRRGLVDTERLHRMTEERLRFFGIVVGVDEPMAVLSPSEQRLVTIAAALSKSAKLILLDEPTAALTEDEASHLFGHLRRMHEQGAACLYISHRLDEIERIADRVVVMRNGAVVARLDSARGSHADMVRAMIGRDLGLVGSARSPHGGQAMLSVADLTVHDPAGLARPRAEHVSFTLHQGEILGLFGLVGAGRTELARALFGSWPGRVDGRIKVGDTDYVPTSPGDAISAGLAMLTENRKQTGIVENQSVLANISAASLDAVSGRALIDDRREVERGTGFLSRLDIRPPRLDIAIQSLSGGNQQKVLLARWIATRPKVLILDEPTIGVDVGARFELYRLIRDIADEGCAILLISSDLNEVIEECDRILVMYKGRITAEFGHGPERHAVMAAATGGRVA